MTPKEITNTAKVVNIVAPSNLEQDKENLNANKRKMTKTDRLLADIDEMYMTDDSAINESSSVPTEVKQKRLSNNGKENTANNIVLGNIKHINLNECLSTHKQIPETMEVDSNTELSEAKNKQIEIDENETIIKHFGALNSNHNEKTNQIIQEEEEEERDEMNALIKNGFDYNAISNDIYGIKLFSNSTYLAPFVPFNQSNNQKKFIPFFESLANLELVSQQQKTNMKCKVIAKINKFAIHSPQITNVYVYCKKCNYINFVPYHSADIHQSGIMNKILNEYNEKQNANTSNNNNMMSASTQRDTLEELPPMADHQKDESEMHAVNFSLDWFLNAKLSASAELPSSQITQSRPINNTQFAPNQQNDEQNCPIMYYECPRCAYFYNEQQQSSQDEYTTVPSTQDSLSGLLDYIYRFWFTLRDSTSKLEPCLVEGELAEKLVGSISPIKFYSNLKKSHLVYTTLRDIFADNEKYLLTIQTFHLKNTHKDVKKIDTLYKIVDIQEIKPFKAVSK